MVGKLLLYMLSFFGVMALGPAVLVLAIFVFKFDLGRTMAHYPWTCATILGLYGALIVFMYFRLQDRFIIFRPQPGTPVYSKAEVVDHLAKAFRTPVEGKKLFDFRAEGDRAVITWSSSLDYFQITNVGGRGMKRVIVLTFDEAKHEAFFIMKDKDWRWNVSKDFFDISLSYSAGIFAEYEMDVYPSISFSPSGGLKVDLKKLAYSSGEPWNPIQSVLLSSGWTLRGGMLPKFSQRALFFIPFGLFCFALGILITGLGGSLYARIAGPGKPAFSEQVPASKPGSSPAFSLSGGTQGTPGADTRKPLPANASPLEKMVRHMTTENLGIVLDGLVKTPSRHLNDEHRAAFVVYGNEYLSRPDKREDFAVKLRKSAAKNRIAGLAE